MERFPKKIEDDKLFSAFDFIFRNAMGNVVVGKDTPTKSTMKSNSAVYFDDEIFFKLADGTTFKISVTAVS